MADRKEVVRRAMTDALVPSLERGEKVRAAGMTLSGPSPNLYFLAAAVPVSIIVALTQLGDETSTAAARIWVTVACGAIVVLFYAGGLALLNRSFYLAVTNRRVLWLETTKLTLSPVRVAVSDPLDEASLVRGKVGKSIGHLVYRRPNGSTIRLNFYRMWRPEMLKIHAALSPDDAVPDEG